MTNSQLIVKVGKKSKLKFSHSKVYRAIDVDSLHALSNYASDCHIVIIESINKNEEKATKEFIKQFKDKDSKNVVMFYIPEEDDITSGLADELEYNIFMSLDSLYKEIYNCFGINVSTFIKDKKELNSINNEYDIDNISGIFGEVNEEFNTDIQETIDKAELDENSFASNKESNDIKIEENSDETFKNYEDSLENINIKDEEAILEINRLKMLLKDAKSDYSVIQKDMVDAIARTEQLEKIVKVLTDENETIKNTFNEIVLSDVILEDPIPLSEYEGLKTNLDSANNKVKELEHQIENLKETIRLNNETIEENENKLEEKQSKLDELNDSINSGDIHKDIIDKYEKDLDEINIENESIKKDLDSLQKKYDDLMTTLSYTEESLSIYVKYREQTVVLFNLLINKNKIKEEEISELNNKLKDTSLKLENANKLVADNRKEIETLKSDIITLNNDKNKLVEEKEDIRKRSEISNNYSDQEIKKLTDKVSQLDTKLKFTEEQLRIKENQYNAMVERTTLESSSTQSLVDTNKSLEQINKSLREKLSIISREVEQSKNEKETLKVQLESAKSQCKNLNNAVQALSGANGVNINILGNNSVKQVAYNSKAQIIPVFGSGSFGITTTAMSLAYKLCMTSKVLYIDLDLVSPRADSWFGKMPMISSVPGVPGTGLNDTGLGILFNKGISVVSAYLPNIIIKGCEVTKGGGIDYISGCYGKIEQSKIADTDFTTFLSLIGNLYNYIIIDMGKLGNNEVTDSLIKVLSDISYKSIAVTTSDRFDVRDFKNKLIENNINLNKLAWLLNMCEATTVEDKVKQYINPTSFGIMLYDPTMKIRTKFMKNKVNKDKLDLFINSAVFSGK